MWICCFRKTMCLAMESFLPTLHLPARLPWVISDLWVFKERAGNEQSRRIYAAVGPEFLLFSLSSSSSLSLSPFSSKCLYSFFKQGMQPSLLAPFLPFTCLTTDGPSRAFHRCYRFCDSSLVSTKVFIIMRISQMPS